MTLSLGWFSTGRGPGSRGLLTFILDRIRSGEIKANVEFVFSNRAQGEGEGSDEFHDLVRANGIPLITYSSRRFRREYAGEAEARRVAYDRQVMKLIRGYKPDVCVLAGYMLIVGPEMCRRYDMLNLHPALPDGPVGTWEEVIWSLIGSEAPETGAMVHLAVEEVDRGPVVAFFSLPVRGPEFAGFWGEVEGRSLREIQDGPGEELPLFKRIREEGYRREPYLLAEALKALAQGEVVISEGRVLDAKGDVVDGVSLTERIEQVLRGL